MKPLDNGNKIISYDGANQVYVTSSQQTGNNMTEAAVKEVQQTPEKAENLINLGLNENEAKTIIHLLDVTRCRGSRAEANAALAYIARLEKELG